MLETPEPADDAAVLDYAASPSPWQQRNRKRKRTALVAMFPLAFLAGIVDGLAPMEPEGNLFLLGFSLALAALVLFWMLLDAQERGARVSTGLRFLTLGLLPLGFGAYCLLHRRFLTLVLGGMMFLGVCLVFALAATGASVLR
jgi:hypothetical protein